MLRSLLASILLTAVLAMPAVAGGHGAPSGHGSSSGGHGASGGGEKKEDSKKAVAHKITQSESYVMVEPIYTSILEGNRAKGMLMIGVGLDIPDAELREKAETAMPALRDAYVRHMMVFTATSVRSSTQPDVTAIADRLQRVTDRMLKRKGARLLLAQVAIRLNR